MPIYQLGEDLPEIHPSAFIADSATIIGKVKIEAGVSIWYNVVIRGDNELIAIGKDSNVQESSTLHTDMGFPLTIGERVTVGHQAMLHGCTIENDALIGIQAVVLNGAHIGPSCLVGAGALVTEGKKFEAGKLIIGSPAKAVRDLSAPDQEGMKKNAAHYAVRAQEYKTQLKKIS